MKKTTLILLVFSFNVFAAKVIFTNNNEEAQISGNASIDLETGDVRVETATPQLIVGGNALLSVFPDTYEANANESITMNYMVARGISCVGSTNRGVVSNWSTNLSSNDGTYSRTVNVGNIFPINFTVTCNNKLGAGTVSDTVTIIERTTSTGPGLTPSVTVLANGSASNTSVTSGSSVNLTYNITNNDLPCTFTSSPTNTSWNALNSSSSSTGNFPATINQNSSFTISCTNSDNNSDADSISISIAGTSSCASHQPPAGTTQQFGISYQGETGFEFGFATSSSANFSLNKNEYAAMLVTAPGGTTLLRKNSFEVPTADHTPAEYTVSLSKCPGDFQVSSTEVGLGRCVVTGQTPVLRWTTKTNPTATDIALKCILNKNEQYYLNVIHSATSPFTQTSCTDFTDCGVLFTELLDN